MMKEVLVNKMNKKTSIRTTKDPMGGCRVAQDVENIWEDSVFDDACTIERSGEVCLRWRRWPLMGWQADDEEEENRKNCTKAANSRSKHQGLKPYRKKPVLGPETQQKLETQTFTGTAIQLCQKPKPI